MSNPTYVLSLVIPRNFFFFSNDTATTDIYTLSLHDALPISFPILASLLVRLVVLLPFQLLRLSLATPSRWTPAITGVVEMEIGRAVQQECRDRSRMPSSA